MEFCEHCGKNIAPGIKLCENCGAPVNDQLLSPPSPPPTSQRSPETLTTLPGRNKSVSQIYIAVGIAVVVMIIVSLFVSGVMSGTQASQKAVVKLTLDPIGAMAETSGPPVSQKVVVKPNDTVKVHYTAALASNGQQFESSLNGTPIEFVAGSGMVIPGFDKAVIGMGIGENKTVMIPADQAYGQLFLFLPPLW